MSKNNFSERLRKMQPRKDHYSIRKFSVGVASVLIGFSFLGLANSQVVKADSNQEVAESSENKIASSSEPSEDQKQVAQSGQEKLDQGQESISNSESEQNLTAIKVAAVQAVQKQEANETAIKTSNLTGTVKSGQKIAAGIGLAGRKDVQGTVKDLTSEKQEITISSAKSSKDQSEKESTVAADKTDTLKATGAKSDAASGIANAKSSATDSEKSSNDDYQIDTQSLDSLTVNEAESDKSSKTDQADKLSKELGANLIVDKSGKTTQFTLKGNGTGDELTSGTEQTLNINKTAGQDVKNKKNEQDAKKLVRSLGTSLAEETPTKVSDWQGLADAIMNPNVHEIQLTNNINITGGLKNNDLFNNPPEVAQSGAELKFGGKNTNIFKPKSSGVNIARNLTIDGTSGGKTNYALNFGKHYISFTTDNQENGTPWDLTFKNVTINADGYSSGNVANSGAYSPIYMGDVKSSLLAKNKVTFDGVTADVKNGAFYTSTKAQLTSDNPYTTVTFKGKNNITCESVNVKGSDLNNYSSAVMASHIIFADGTDTTFNVATKKTNNDTNAGGNILRAKIEDSNDTEAPIIVEQGAEVTLNGNSKDVKGILVNNAITGDVQINGKMTMNLGSGHSMAIEAGNLIIGKYGNLTIHTQQNNNNNKNMINAATNYDGFHFGVVNLGVGFGANITNADSNTLTDNGKLTIIRTGSASNQMQATPLISFGSAAASLLKGTFTINVGNGATLDLQDSQTATQKNPNVDNAPLFGLITMWGNGDGTTKTSNTINFNNPGYVNLQRTGSQTGSLVRLENVNNHINITSNNSSLPVARWDDKNTSDTPSFYWLVNHVNSQNNVGDYSTSGFTQSGKTKGQYSKGDTFLHSNGSVVLTGNQAGTNSFAFNNGNVTQGVPTNKNAINYYSPYLNQFLNHFNYSDAQRIAMGSDFAKNQIKLNDSQKYQPETTTIYTNMDHKLSDLSVQDGIEDLIGPDGIVKNSAGQPDLSLIDWNNAGTTWIAGTLKDSNGNLVDQTKNFTAKGDYTAQANIFYKDGSHDEKVVIPIHVGDKESDTYDAHYQGTKAEKGKETDVAKPTIKNSSTGNTATDDLTKHTSYSAVTTGSDQTPSWVTVNSSDGSLKLNPDDNVTVGMKSIPIQVKYGDGSSEITDAPVYVSDGDHSVIWGHDANGNTIGAVVLVTDPSKLNAHETSYNSQVLTPADAVTGIEEYTVADNGKATLADHLDKSKVKISWEEAKTPNTVVTTPSNTGSTSGTLHVDLNGQANTYLGNDSGSVFENNMTIPMVGATAKNPSTPVNVGFHTKLTKDEFDDLVVNNIPADEIAGYTWHNADGTDTLPEKATTATIRITFNDKDKNGNPTYLDIKLPANSLKVTSDADHYTVAYGDIKVARPNDDSTNSESEEPTVTPSTVSAGTISNYAIDSSFTSPTGVTISVDKNGKITATANKNAILGSFKVPVNVTYADTSTAKVNVTVSVTGFDKDPHGGQTHYYGDQTMLTFGLPVITVHKTTGTNIYDASQIKFDKIYYYYNWSGQGYDASAYKNHKIYDLNAERTKYVNEDDSTDAFNASDLHTSWRTVGGYTYQADTDESKFSDGTTTIHYRNADGSINSTGAEEEQTAVDGTLPENLAGNSKYRFNFSFQGSDVPSGLEVPNGIWSNVYFNFLGATGKTNIPVNVGDTVPTDADAIEKYLDSNDVGTPSDSSTNNKWQVTNISWENGDEPGSNGKFDANKNDLNGIVRFDFKDSNGNTSYLDVKVSFKTGSYVPHNNNNNGKNDDTNLYVTRIIHYDVPVGETAVPDVVQSVHYIRDGYKHLGTDGKEDSTYIWNAWKLADGQTAKFPEIETVKQFTGYDSYIQVGNSAANKGTTVSSAKVIENNGTPQDGEKVTITYVKQNATAIKYDPNSHDDNMSVDRHITYDVSGTGHTAIDPVDQKVDYVREDADGNAGYKDPITGKITYVAWTVKNNGSALFPARDVIQIPGYDSYIQVGNSVATKGTTASSENVNVNNDGTPQNGTAVTITYRATKQYIKYQFVDDDKDGATVDDAIEVDGKTNGTINPSRTVKVPAGYQLAPGQTIPTQVELSLNNPDLGKIIDIHLVHGSKLINPGDNIPAGSDPTKGQPNKNIKSSDSQHTLKRIITVTNLNGSINAPVVQTIDFQRTGHIDTVTGAVTWDDWKPVDATKDSFAEYKAPAIKGYTPTQSAIAENNVNYTGQADEAVEIHYMAGDQSMTYTFVDDDEGGATVGSPVIISGNTGKTVNTRLTIPDGYKLANGQTIPNTYTFKNSNPSVDIHLTHVISPVIGPKGLPKPGDKIPGTHKVYPDDATKDKNFEHDVTRTVTINIPNVDPQISVQRVHFTRTATVDAVTNKITYTDWTVDGQDSFVEIDAPIENGFVASAKNAPLVTGVKETDADSIVTINYTKVGNYVPVDENGNRIPNTSKTPYANDPHDPTKVQTTVPDIPNYTPKYGKTQIPSDPTKDTNVVYIPTADAQHIDYQFVDDDNNGAKVGSAIPVRGITNETVDPSQTVKVPAGYKLAAGQSIPTSVKLSKGNKELGKTVDIHLVHNTRTVKPGDVPTPGSRIPGDNGHKKPGDNNPTNDIIYNDLHKDITRTITVYTPNETPTVIIQTVSYQRDATIDDVTGKVTYDNWVVNPTSTEKTLAEYDVPSVNGYTSSLTKVDSETPTSDQVENWIDPNIKITYTPQHNGGDNGGGNIPTPPTQGEITIHYVDKNGKTIATKTIPVNPGSTVNPSSAIKDNVPNGYKLPDGYTAPTSATDGSSIDVPVQPSVKQNTGKKKSSTTNKKVKKNSNHHGKDLKGNHSAKVRKHNWSTNSSVKGERNKFGIDKAIRTQRANGHNRANVTVKAQANRANKVANSQINNIKNSKAETLPQTGDNSTKSALSLILGLAAVALASLFGLGGDRKRR